MHFKMWRDNKINILVTVPALFVAALLQGQGCMEPPASPPVGESIYSFWASIESVLNDHEFLRSIFKFKL